MDRCPKGHKLPNRTPYGQCLPQKCAKPESKNKGKNPHTRRAETEAKSFSVVAKEAGELATADGTPSVRAALAQLSPAELPLSQMKPAALESVQEEARHIARGLGGHLARRAFLQVPEGLAGDAADKWVSEQLTEASVDAAAELRYQQKMGNDSTRLEVALRVLDATGHGKREGGLTVSGPIIILQGAEVANPPWVKPALVTVNVLPGKK